MRDEQCDLLCIDFDQAESLRRDRPERHLIERAAARAQALADPTRLTIATALRGTELCVCDLAWILEKPQNLVSHHLRALRKGGIASSRRDGRMVMYSLTAVGSAVLASVLDDAEVPA